MKTQREIYHDMFVYSDKSPSFLFWNVRPSYQFASLHGHRCCNAQYAGKPAGSKIEFTSRVKGDCFYWYITNTNPLTRKFCPDYGVHRIIYKMFHGDIPKGMEVDHIDNDTTNNHKDNLRLVTKNQNQQNSRAKQTAHLKGAYPLKKSGGWTSFIAKDKKRIYLGYYPTEQLAHEAYCEASKRLHGEFSRVS